jgi:hypothetical protein
MAAIAAVAEKRRSCVYILRVEPYDGPYDVVAKIIQAAWSAVVREGRFPDMDSLHWRNLYHDIRRAFQRRMVSFPECGRLRGCGKNLRRVYAHKAVEDFQNRWASSKVYTLEAGRGLNVFVHAISVLILRRLRKAAAIGPRETRVLEARLIIAVERALSSCFYWYYGFRKLWDRFRAKQYRLKCYLGNNNRNSTRWLIK